LGGRGPPGPPGGGGGGGGGGPPTPPGGGGGGTLGRPPLSPAPPPFVGRGWPEPDKQAGLRGLALYETSPRARAWAVGAARGLTRHGPLRSRAGPGTARR